VKKIPTLFQRTEDRRHVTDRVTPGCEWVLAGEGDATRKYDGTCVMYDGEWWFRREVKAGKTEPPGFISSGYDDTTGKTVGWEPAENSGFISILSEATENAFPGVLLVGTYELCGPKINGNPEKLARHELVEHGRWVLQDAPRDYEGLREWMRASAYEGIVWHHPDGRMAKLKRRDFPTA
jgi:hypothetical protein